LGEDKLQEFIECQRTAYATSIPSGAPRTESLRLKIPPATWVNKTLCDLKSTNPVADEADQIRAVQQQLTEKRIFIGASVQESSSSFTELAKALVKSSLAAAAASAAKKDNFGEKRFRRLVKKTNSTAALQSGPFDVFWKVLRIKDSFTRTILSIGPSYDPKVLYDHITKVYTDQSAVRSPAIAMASFSPTVKGTSSMMPDLFQLSRGKCGRGKVGVDSDYVTDPVPRTAANPMVEYPTNPVRNSIRVLIALFLQQAHPLFLTGV